MSINVRDFIPRNRWVQLTLVIVSVILLKSVFPYKLFNKRYIPEDDRYIWYRGIDHPRYLQIARIMVKNKVKGCGLFYIGTKKGSVGQHLLACTQDDKTFVYKSVDEYSEIIQPATGKGVNYPGEY